MSMEDYETEISKHLRNKFGKLKKGDVIRTHFNEKNEILSSIRVNVNKYGVIKIDLKQFEGYNISDNDLYVGEILENLFDYTFNFCNGDEVDHIENTIII